MRRGPGIASPRRRLPIPDAWVCGLLLVACEAPAETRVPSPVASAVASSPAPAVTGASPAKAPASPVAPAPLVVRGRIVDLAAGDAFTCAALAGGRVQCWGDNEQEQLGAGPGPDRRRPVTVAGVEDAVELAAGRGHACARRRSGHVVCWGDDRLAQLGRGHARSEPAPAEVVGLDDAVQIGAGPATTCALRRTGAAVCWGANDAGQATPVDDDCRPIEGGGSRCERPVEIPDLASAVEVRAGGFRSCARLADGHVTCWGTLADATLGYQAMFRVTRDTVAGVDDAVQIGVGLQHTCARRAMGDVVCWGRPEHDQRPSEIRAVGNLPDARSIAAGSYATCAVRAAGPVACWERDPVLVAGGRTFRAGAEEAPGLAGAARIAVGGGHTCALFEDGRVLCSGLNEHGQLGDGSIRDRARPVAVKELGL